MEKVTEATLHLEKETEAMAKCNLSLEYLKVTEAMAKCNLSLNYRGSSPNAHDGTWEKPCYAKSRCVRLLLCNECSTETPKPRKIEESVLDEVTTV